MKTPQLPPAASRTKIAIFLVAFALILGGVLLESTVGSRFIFFYSTPYTSVGWWAFGLLLPVFAVTMFTKRAKSQLRLRYPTWWVRWLFMYPLTVAFAAASVVIAPLGWIAAITWALGVDTGPTVGRLVSVKEYRPSSKGCDQRGNLVVREHIASVCLEGLSALPVRGDLPIIIAGRQSSLGLVLVGITPQ